MDNKMAWVLAGIFGVTMAVVIVWVVFFPSPSGPTHRTLAPGQLDLQKPAYPVTHVLPSAPADGGDAGDDYHQAITTFKARRQAVQAACATQGTLSGSELALLEEIQAHVSAGARRQKMTYAFRHTPREILPPYVATEARDFQDLASVPIRLSEHYVAQPAAGYAKAEQALFDLFAMGHHMIEERARLDTVLFGIGLQGSACDLLRQLYAPRRWNKPARFRKAKEYSGGLDGMLDVYQTHQRKVLWPGRHNAREENVTGDVYNLVRKHADRAIRAEATVVLGVIKLRAPLRGDRRYAAKLISRQLNSPDPIEQAAARAARDLDPDGLADLMNREW